MSEFFSYYCIVCQKTKTIDLDNVVKFDVKADVKYGGWFCGRHSKDELEKAKVRMTGKLFDRLGHNHMKYRGAGL